MDRNRSPWEKRIQRLPTTERDARGWKLGFEHLREAGIVGLARSTLRGTFHLWVRPPMYAVKWSTVTQDESAQFEWNAMLKRRLPWYLLGGLAYYALALLSGWVVLRWRQL